MRASNRTTEPQATPVPDAPVAEPLGGAGPVTSWLAGTTTDSRYVEPPHGMLDLKDNHPIAEVVYRQRAQVGGRVRSVRIRPWGEVITLECVIADDTAAITVAFLGRRAIAGIRPGNSLTVEGMVGQSNGKLVILNPAYDLRPL